MRGSFRSFGLRRPLRSFGVLGIALSLATWFIFHILNTTSSQPSFAIPNRPALRQQPAFDIVLDELPSRQLDEWDPIHWLRENRTHFFRDALKPGEHYITGGSAGGLTNMFLGYANLIYLAMISDRIAVIPPFFPNEHFAHDSPAIPFGNVFDLRHLSRTLGIPILEWRDLKIYSPYSSQNHPAHPDQLGCWAATSCGMDTGPLRVAFREDILNLEVSYTQGAFDLFNRNSRNQSLLYPLAALIYPRDENEESYPGHVSPNSMAIWSPGPRSGHLERPSRHLSCFDDLYYATTNPSVEFEWFFQYSPQWRTVVKHLRFREELKGIATQYISDILQIEATQNIPPFIAVHIRRGDFSLQCSKTPPPLECFAPLAEWGRLVTEVQQELRHGPRKLDARQVIVASDETDLSFWKEVKAQGWHGLDHQTLGTEERLGNEWWAPVLDTVILSMSSGFVGTKGSTFSLLAKRRVENWNGGISRERTSFLDSAH